MPEAAVAEKEKTVSVMNLSKAGRRYELKGGIRLMPNQASEVPASEADFLLSRLPNGKARFPDLVDAAKMSPEAAKVKKQLVDENDRLRKENEGLRAQVAAVAKAEAGEGEAEEKHKKGGKK